MIQRISFTLTRYSLLIAFVSAAAGADDCKNSLVGGNPGDTFNVSTYLKNVIDQRGPLHDAFSAEQTALANFEKKITSLESLTLAQHERTATELSHRLHHLIEHVLKREPPHAKLSDEELRNRIVAQQKEAVELGTLHNLKLANRRSAESEANKVGAQAVEKILPPLEAFLKTRPEYLADMEDSINYFGLMRMRGVSTISIFVGSMFAPADRSEVSAAVHLVQGAVEKGYTVLLDAHSNVTPEIMRQVPDRVYAVGATLNANLPEPRQYIIKDPYLRWKALTRYDQRKERLKLIGWSSSPITMAAGLSHLLNWQAESISEAIRINFHALVEWTERLIKDQRDLRLETYKDVTQRNPYSILEKLKRKEASHYQKLTLKDLTADELEEATERADILRTGRPRSAKAQVVLYGTNSTDRVAAPMTYAIGYKVGQNGYGLATGGSHGAMFAGNMGAFDSGGESIGIPVTGQNQVAREQDFPIELHTETISTNGYATRLPLLFYAKKAVIFVPGGSGTMRELVTAIMLLNDPEAASLPLIFVQSSYYAELVKLLRQGTLGTQITQNIYVAEDEHEVENLLHGFEKSGILREVATTGQTITPRSDRHELPPMR